MAIPTRLPPAKIQRLWPVGWGGLRTTLERHSENNPFSPADESFSSRPGRDIAGLDIIVAVNPQTQRYEQVTLLECMWTVSQVIQ